MDVAKCLLAGETELLSQEVDSGEHLFDLCCQFGHESTAAVEEIATAEAMAYLLDVAILIGDAELVRCCAKHCTRWPLRRWRGDELVKIIEDDFSLRFEIQEKDVLIAALAAGLELCSITLRWRKPSYFPHTLSSGAESKAFSCSWGTGKRMKILTAWLIFSCTPPAKRAGLVLSSFRGCGHGGPMCVFSLLDLAILFGQSDCARLCGPMDIEATGDTLKASLEGMPLVWEDEVECELCGVCTSFRFRTLWAESIASLPERQAAAAEALRAALQASRRKTAGSAGFGLFQTLRSWASVKLVPVALVNLVLTFAAERPSLARVWEGRDGELPPLGHWWEESVHQSPANRGDGPDFASNAAVAAWKQAQGRGAELVHQEPFDLALAILRRLEDAESLAHIMVEQGGGLRFFTREHIRAQAAKGKVLCKGCGFFFGEGNPMRTHVQNATDTRCFSVEAAEYYLRPCQDDISAEAPEGSPAGVAKTPPPDPCLEAAQRGDLVALRALVVAGRDATKATDHRGNGVLHWAAGGGHVDVCEYLLHELKMDARARTSKHHGRTALHWAARNGHAAVCALLLDAAGDDFVDAATDGGDTPLMLAAWQGHVTCCSLLVSRRADVHHTNSWGCNAMHKASRMDGASSSLEMLEYLTHSRVDAGLVNCNGHNSLHKAAQFGSVPAARFLLDAGLRTRAAVTPDRDRNAPSALAFAARFRALAAELRHMEDLLWLTPALYVPMKAAEDYRTTDDSVTDISSR
ncbi:unnamed protein product [Symbiodinium necroappetens]|uniref:Uncharacterized protein n=1 Tax=Symbiodinium necroappetens TaxID=1628268 RepID=A0A812YAF7_9DINO|nr:unnamed protein product [Symbiodinium necroappetens]